MYFFRSVCKHEVKRIRIRISHAVRGLKRVYYRLPSLRCPYNMLKYISPLPHLCSRPPSKDIRKDIAGIIIQGVSDPDQFQYVYPPLALLVI